MPAKSIQKPREQKNSSGAKNFDQTSVVSVFHVPDFLPLLRRVIRPEYSRGRTSERFGGALRQFLLTFR